MPEGSVRWFNAAKGYGYLIPDEGGTDRFVHHSQIRMDGYRTLSEGQRVRYDVQETEKGPAATNVEVI